MDGDMRPQGFSVLAPFWHRNCTRELTVLSRARVAVDAMARLRGSTSSSPMNSDLQGFRLSRALTISIAVIAMMWLAAEVLKPIAFSILLAFILSPLVGWFERRGLPRWLGTLLSLGILIALGVGVGI